MRDRGTESQRDRERERERESEEYGNSQGTYRSSCPPSSLYRLGD
jgi:hypothetical protein